MVQVRAAHSHATASSMHATALLAGRQADKHPQPAVHVCAVGACTLQLQASWAWYDFQPPTQPAAAGSGCNTLTPSGQQP